jgi:hypothetical protein
VEHAIRLLLLGLGLLPLLGLLALLGLVTLLGLLGALFVLGVARPLVAGCRSPPLLRAFVCIPLRSHRPKLLVHHRLLDGLVCGGCYLWLLSLSIKPDHSLLRGRRGVLPPCRRDMLAAACFARRLGRLVGVIDVALSGGPADVGAA